MVTIAVFDTDGSDCISKDELKVILGGDHTDEELKDLINLMDKDGDTKLQIKGM